MTCKYPEVFGYEIEELTPHWLTLLARQLLWLNEEQFVTSFEVSKLEELGYKTIVYSLSLSFSSPVPEGVPRSIVAKMAKLIDGKANQHILRYFKQEYQFFEHFKGKQCQLRIPQYYYGDYSDQEGGKFVFLMEDLRYDNGKQGDQIAGIEIEYIQEILRDLGEFHAVWWDAPALTSLPWLSNSLPAVHSYCDYFSALFPSFLADCPLLYKEVTENVKSVAEFMAGGALKMTLSSARPSLQKRTLVHGDMRGDNLILWPLSNHGNSSAHYSTLDFQCVHYGNPAEDVAYLLGGSLSLADYSLHHLPLLHLYYSSLTSHLPSLNLLYPFDRFLEDYNEVLIISLITPIISACRRKQSLAVSPPSSIPAKGSKVDQLIERWLERAVFTIDHHLPHSALSFLQSRWNLDHTDPSDHSSISN